MYTELKYRTFNELLESVLIDFRSIEEEGMIEPAQLIKIAQACSYTLGLKLNKIKETIIEVNNGLSRLPDDFYVLKFAAIVGKYRILDSRLGTPDNLPGGRWTEDHFIPNQVPVNLTNCPCWTVISLGATVKITYCDGTIGTITFAANPDGSAATTTICATAIQPDQNLTLIRGNGCWEYNGGFHCLPQDINACSTCNAPYGQCNHELDPMRQSLIYSQCNGVNQVRVLERRRGGEVREYHQFERLAIRKSKWTDPACMNTGIRSEASASIKDGFLYTSFPTGKVFISYLGNLEDEDGNLLVIDNPILNEFYEYALKTRILENLFYADESVEKKLRHAEGQLDKARKSAISLVSMPDFNEIKSVYHASRKAMENIYMRPFSVNFNQYNH